MLPTNPPKYVTCDPWAHWLKLLFSVADRFHPEMSKINSWARVVSLFYNLAAVRFTAWLVYLRHLGYQPLNNFLSDYTGVLAGLIWRNPITVYSLTQPTSATSSEWGPAIVAGPTSSESTATQTTEDPLPGRPAAKRTVHKLYVVAKAAPGCFPGIFYLYSTYARQVHDQNYLFGGRKIVFAPGTVSCSFPPSDRTSAYEYFRVHSGGLEPADHLYGFEEP